MKSNAPEHPTGEAAEQAIASVLQAEREARVAIERTQLAAEQTAEAARAEARALAERTERRVRAVVGAFQRTLAGRLARIDAEVERMATLDAPSDSELGALDRAVRALARELTGAPP